MGSTTEDNFQESFLSFRYVHLRDQIQLTMLSRNPLYSLSHLDNPRTHVSNKFSHALCAAAGQGHLDWEATVRSTVCQNCPLGAF